jgi:hypothetical protein
MNVLYMGQVFLVPAQQIETGRKNVIRNIGALPGGKKAWNTLPSPKIDLKIVDSLFEQQVVAPDEKFVLQGLFGIGDLWAVVFDEVFDLGGEQDFNAQYPRQDMLHDITEARGDLMGINEQHGLYFQIPIENS